MNPVIRQKKAYWIGGTITGLFGVGLVRLLAPELAGAQSVAAIIAGFTLVITGITILTCATRRKQPEAFITVGKDAKD